MRADYVTLNKFQVSRSLFDKAFLEIKLTIIILIFALNTSSDSKTSYKHYTQWKVVPNIQDSIINP